MHGMPQLDFYTYPGQVVWFLLFFLATYFFVSVFLVPAIRMITDRRNAALRQAVLEASDLLRVCESKLGDYKSLVDSANAESCAVVRGAEKSAGDLISTISSLAAEEFLSLRDIADPYVRESKLLALKKYEDLAFDAVVCFLSKLLPNSVAIVPVDEIRSLVHDGIVSKLSDSDRRSLGL